MEMLKAGMYDRKIPYLEVVFDTAKKGEYGFTFSVGDSSVSGIYLSSSSSPFVKMKINFPAKADKDKKDNYRVNIKDFFKKISYDINAFFDFNSEDDMLNFIAESIEEEIESWHRLARFKGG